MFEFYFVCNCGIILVWRDLNIPRDLYFRDFIPHDFNPREFIHVIPAWFIAPWRNSFRMIFVGIKTTKHFRQFFQEHNDNESAIESNEDGSDSQESSGSEVRNNYDPLFTLQYNFKLVF